MTKTLLAAAALLSAVAAHAAVSVTSPAFTYTQTFDALATTGTTNAWSNDITLVGWHLFGSTGAAIATYTGNDGSSNAGNFYSFGSTGSSDRALGGTASGGAYFGAPAAGAIAGWIAVSFTNDSGAPLAGFTLTFDGEQWRNGGNATAQSMAVEYGFGASFASAVFAPAPASFVFSSPVATATAAALDGNAAGNRAAGLGGTITEAWAPGQTLWVRWVERNDTGNDHGLAIDNVSLSVTPVPEPGTNALLLTGLGTFGVLAARRRRG